MTDMVIDYTLEPFQVPDLNLRSQEPPPKSRSVLFFISFIEFIEFLGVLGVWNVFLGGG